MGCVAGVMLSLHGILPALLPSYYYCAVALPQRRPCAGTLRDPTLTQEEQQ